MKNYLKRTTTFILALLMLLSVPLQAFAEVNYDNLAGDKAKIINKLKPVKPAKPEAGKTAEDLIKDPDQPEIYTLRTDYKVQRGDKYEVDYQPYIASVGEAATEEEKAKVNQTVKLPDLTGYEKPDDDYLITYDKVKNAGNNGSQEFRYKSKANAITIKHVFQDLHDFTKYTNPDGSVGEEGQLITTQNGNTGSTMEVSPLNDNHPNRKGFVPEAPFITMQVPENAENFVLEYRYNRAHYDVKFDTKGGTPVPARTLYYEQIIPKIADKSIPTKVGGIFQGWKPSITLETTDGKTYQANEIIKYPSGNSINNLPANLKMPASNVTFTAVWKDKEKADYAIQFWAEKADHADGASLMDKYDYMGTRVYKGADTGTRPDLNKEPVNGLKFPDLDNTRLQKIWKGEKFNRGHDLYLNKFFVYNQALTADQNKDPEKVDIVKSVSATGKTVYNIYYDRQVYDLYFTKSNAQPEENTIDPEIWGYDPAKGEAVMLGGPGNLYHYKARFNEMMYKWPNDAKQTKGFTPGYQSFGWGPNYDTSNWPEHLDTPPYRLNADQFLDMANYTNWGGYVKHIDKGDGTTIDLQWSDFTTLSFGIKQDHPSIPHHMDFWMDGFKDGETIIRYDLVRTKADTAGLDYGHKYPIVTGFTPHDYEPGNPQSAWPVIKEGSEENGRVNEEEINDLNDDRDEITPNNCGSYYNNNGIKLPIGQLDFIPSFFSDSDDFGDVKEGGQEFTENGYLQFHYKRNKYPLRFNYDPSIIRDDSYFNSKNQLDTFYEFPLKVLSPDLVSDDTERKDREYFKEDPKNFIDNPENLQKLGLTDLVFTDPKDNKLKVKRPEGLSDQMVFKGWALDPAGTKLVWENKDEKMPFHPLNLYAKWGEPDYKWKVTFDPDGGNLRRINEENLTKERKTIQEGDIGQEEVNTYAKKGYLEEGPTTQDGKQIFTVIQRQKLVEPNFKPTKKGYDFMGWEVIRYKKDAKTGDYTDEIDNSYRETYKVPELYSFGNDVVSPIYLKAIWVPNERVDVKIEHYFLDKKYNLDTDVIPNPEPDRLVEKRAGYLVATTGDKQDEKYILAPHSELEDHKDTSNVYSIYKEYNDRVKLDNSFFQTFRVEPEKILNTETNQMEENPKAKNNVFKFFYRPFRQREYKVNYIDERFKTEVEKFFKELNLKDTSGLKDDALLKANEENKKKFEAKRPDFEELIKKYQIIDPEAVTNGNRHYDARNYRPIPGWKLVSDPQQQLFFDVNEKTNDFLGINGTGGDQIFFYYKDVRVIEVPGKDNPPEGYVRVTFKADKGGSFGKNAEGKDITELNYDVIKGLKSDLLPVPGDPTEENKREKDKYYITPDDGKKFIKWDEKPLLNKNTIIENETKDFYVFTAKFEWSGLTAKGMVRTEAFKDPNGKWTNDFAPTIDQLKAQLEWKEKDEVKPLPTSAKIQFFDPDGNELTKDEQVYELVKEMGKADKDELVRTVNIKAKVTFKDGKEPQELTIPITVYKNVYEALNKNGDKPLFLKEAESKEAKDGGLKDVTGDYVMVTIKASKDFNAKDDKIYYVNKNAWVEIPEVKTEGSSTFVNWTADKDIQNENGIFDFGKRHKFNENTVISPSDAKDVVEQKQGEDKPKVPDNYVKVIVKTTDKATTELTQTFWVNPTKEVTIPVTEPTGKENQKVTIDGLGEKDVNYIFKEWQKVQTGEADDNLAKVDPAVKIDLAKNQYTDKVTVVEAAYKKSIQPGKIEEPLSTSKLDTPQGKTIEDKDLIKQITPQEGKEIESIKVIQMPDTSNPGKTEAKVIVTYTDKTTQGTDKDPVVIPVEVHKNIIPEAPGGQRPKDALDNYVKVIFKAGTGGTVSGDLVYYVSPEVEVNMTSQAGAVTKKPSVGYTSNGGTWSPEIKSEKITEEKTYEFNFVKSKDIVEKTGDDVKKPEGYVTVKFIAGENGQVVGGNKTYYVNPEANIKLVDKDKATQGATNELIVPEANANDNYGFTGWVEEIDYTNPIKGDREHVAKFTLGQVTLTYNKGGEDVIGDVPATVSVNHGTSVRLARPEGLSKENATFKGWKLDEDEKIYQPGDQVTLEKSRTATAQWTTDKHKVVFDTDGGSEAPATQEIEHNGHATKPAIDPTKENFVFLGWKEKGKESETAYFEFTTAIKEDKTLVAQWTNAVQKIGEDDTIDTEKFIKVTFKEGQHGKLKLADTEQTSPVTYKVAKGISFAEAKAAGLEVPEIAPAKYYKVKQDQEGEAPKYGWDKELKLEGAEIEFIAQYEPIADVIPVDPAVTDEEQIKEEKPEGMVLVTFVVPEDKAFMTGDTKFYVKANEPVNIETPVVHPLTLDNKHNDYVFKGWSMDTEDENKKVSFVSDTKIDDSEKERPDIQISRPVPKANNIIISVLTDGAKGYLEITGDGIPNNTRIEASKRGRMNIFYINKVIGRGLKRDDVIKIYAVKDGIKSEEREYIVK